MKEIQQCLSVWTELYKECQKMEPLVRAARELHSQKQGPELIEIEAEFKALQARTDAAFQAASEALKKVPKGNPARF